LGRRNLFSVELKNSKN